jgi:uncharacterized membrane protein YqiK
MAYLQNRHEEQERAEARVRAHLLKYHVDVVNVLICHIHLPAELMKTQTEKMLAEQRKAEAEGEAHYILATGKAEAEKVRLMGEAQGVAYREQVNALGPQGVALVETLKVIGEKNVRITPDVLATGGSGDGGGGIGSLLLLNLFKDRLNLPAENGSKAPVK